MNTGGLPLKKPKPLSEKPGHLNRTRGVDDPEIQKEILKIVNKLIQQ